jgi:hypothetical protein
MKKIVLLLIFFTACFIHLNGQKWQWSNQFKSTNLIQPINAVVDNNNNVYIIGTYDISDLTIQGLTISNHGDRDGFICKFDENGTIQWLKSIGGTDREIPVSIVIISNQLFISGDFRSSIVYFTPTDNLVLTNNFDSFLAVYDLNGNFIRATNIFYGNDIQRVKGMIYDSYVNSLIFTGQFKVQLKYFNGTSVQTKLPRGSSGRDHFVIRTNLSGEVQDTIFFTSNSGNTIMKSLDPCLNDGYYIGGDLFNRIDFTSSDYLVGNSTTTADAFLVKLDKNFNFLWARKGGGIGYDHVNSSTTDKYGNIYLAGKCESTITFDSTLTLPSHSLYTFGAQDLYLAKYNKLGTLQWIKRKGNAGDDDAFGLTQRENLVQFCGNISGQVVFNTDTLRSSGISDVNTGFAIFNTNGNEIGAQGIGGSGIDRGEVITFSPNGNTIISGYFDSPTIDIGDSAYSNTSGTSDGFIASYHYPMNAVFTSIKPLPCAGVSDGELIVTPYFGVGPYIYTWSTNVSSSNDSLAFNLGGGTYSVTITDSRDSVASTSIVLSQPSGLSLGAVQSNVSCYPTDGVSNDGSVNLTVTGGTGGRTYNWEAISGSGVNATAEDQTTLTKGIYAVYVVDDNMCEASDTFYIDQPDKIIFGHSAVSAETIPPSGNGAINLSVSGGTPVYTYAWTGPSFSSSNEDINNLFTGSYLITIHDTKSCSSDTSFLVVNDTLMIAYFSGKTDINCNGDNTGTATVSVLNGTGPYTYHWENNLGSTVDGNAPTVINLPADIYYVTVTDNSNSETATASVQLFEPDQPVATNIISTEILCYGDLTGVADLTVTGGMLPYQFSWSNGSTEEDLLNLGYGTYYLTVTDNNGCIANDDISFAQPAAMDIIITTDQPIMCQNDFTGILTATATGGTGLKTYIWDDPGNQTSQTATNLEAGTYHVTATDLNECSVTGQVQLINPEPLIASESHTNVSCFGGDDGIINLSVTGGTTNYNYEWSNGQVSQDISNLTADTFYVTVTDAHNCIAATSSIISQPTELILADIDVNINTISVIVSGGTPPYSYTLDGSIQNTTGVFTNVPGGLHSISVTDDNACGPLTANGIDVPVGINDLTADLFKIYPNPSEGIFEIELFTTTEAEYRIQVFSASGILVFDRILNKSIENNSENSIDLSSQPRGIYLLKINGISINKKLIIQ